MSAFLAALPIFTALVLLAFRVGPVRAAFASVICALTVAIFAFPTALSDLLAAQFQMATIVLEVALILLGGLILSSLMNASGAQQRLGKWVISACSGQRQAVLLIVLGVIPFAESVTGFGIGVVVGIPLLVQLGLSSGRAAVTGLLGLTTVPWGSLGPGTLIASRLSGTDFQDLGVACAWLSAPVFLMAGVGTLVFAFGWRLAVRSMPDLILAAGALWVGVLGVNILIGTPLAGVLGSLFAIGIMLLHARLTGPRSEKSTDLFIRDAAPYLILVSGLLTAKLLVLALPAAFGPSLEVLGSPATWLLLASATIPMVQKIPQERTRQLVTASLKQWQPIALTTVLFLILGVILASSGMSAALAEAGAKIGPVYPAIAPWIGALGGFLTGSNTGASAMFAASQAQAAQVIGYPVLSLVAFHNVAASLAIMAAIPKIMMSVRLAEDAVRDSAGDLECQVSPVTVFARVAIVNAAILTMLSGLALLLA